MLRLRISKTALVAGSRNSCHLLGVNHYCSSVESTDGADRRVHPSAQPRTGTKLCAW